MSEGSRIPALGCRVSGLSLDPTSAQVAPYTNADLEAAVEMLHEGPARRKADASPVLLRTSELLHRVWSCRSSGARDSQFSQDIL